MISQSDADDEAGIVADQVLAPRLQQELNAMSEESTQGRVQAIHTWLTNPDDEFLRVAHGPIWLVGTSEGSTIPVVVYDLWVDQAFVNDSTWGRACREYDVGETLASRDVPCPRDTPSEPPLEAVGGLPQ